MNGETPVLNRSGGSAFCTLQDLLLELRGIRQRCNAQYFLCALYGHLQQRGASQHQNDHAALLVQKLPSYQTLWHRDVASLLDQLTPNARECLRAGLKFREIEDAWDAALQESNYAFLPAGGAGY